jgi:Uroporphyrinogen-III synthase
LEDLLPSLTKHSKEKFLFPVSDVHKDNVDFLDTHNIPYNKAVMYRTVSNDFEPNEEFDYDMLMFFSPSGIDSLMKNFPQFDQGNVRISAFGATTAKAVKDAGLRLDLEAPTAEAPSMTGALDLYLKAEAKKK